MSGRHDDEFYVGYLPQAPPGVASAVRWAVVALVVLAVVAATLFVTGQRRFGAGTFEFGVGRDFVGVIRETPYPMLHVPRPGRTGDLPAVSTYYLVAFGKNGGAAAVEGLDGRPVRLRGSLVYRDTATMIEIEDGSIEPLTGDHARDLAALRLPQPEDLGERTLAGEIVDSKCFLGVMKPGHLKPHRACATRCISGGIPPALVVFDDEGRATYYLLVSADGAPVHREVLPLVAEPVEITGRLVRHGDLLVLHADPTTYRRL